MTQGELGPMEQTRRAVTTLWPVRHKRFNRLLLRRILRLRHRFG